MFLDLLFLWEGSAAPPPTTSSSPVTYLMSLQSSTNALAGI